MKWNMKLKTKCTYTSPQQTVLLEQEQKRQEKRQARVAKLLPSETLTTGLYDALEAKLLSNQNQ